MKLLPKKHNVNIEHNVEVIKKADWIINMGPDGGTNGGEILFAGPPKELCHCTRSSTAKYIE
ncbi:MAG: hypothetical protein AB9856_01810 [Cellulosilyticaceae bacterium]